MARIKHYSRHARETAQLLGKQIRIARKKRQWSEHELAKRAGVSRSSVRKAEQGEMGLEIGLALELATLLNVALYLSVHSNVSHELERSEEMLKLMPETTRGAKEEEDDDF